MARPYAEPERRDALIHSAVELIGERGSLDVTVKDIAKRAGMSSALAFHYFGDKDEIFNQTMRHLLRELGQDASRRLKEAEKPAEKIDAIIQASFSTEQFDRKTVAAWLIFYVRAFSSPMPAKLLSIYTRRTRSNLLFALKKLVPEQDATRIAEGLGAMIDGLYIRHGLAAEGPQAREATALCRDYVDKQLAVNSRLDHQPELKK